MRSEVKMPRVAEGTDELVIEEWLIEVGVAVSTGQGLLRVETDKVTVEVPSPVTGTLVEQLFAEGDDVATGAVIAIIDA
jgi:2-oxoglutarate dehydrogenase E2 component (dihydrolipoamide succinyltransferase)